MRHYLYLMWKITTLFRGYWMAFSYDPLYLILECNIGPGQYCFRAVAWANIALMSQTWRAMRKKPFYNLFIITLAMQKTSDYSLHNLLNRWKISSDLNVLAKDGSFEVLSYKCGINNKEVSISSRSHIVKYNLYGWP